MKTLEEVLNSESMISGYWKTKEDIIDDFMEVTWNTSKGQIEDLFEDINILFAHYGSEGYKGEALVLFTKNDGKLYLVEGSHCSRYGLEGQWVEEETSLELISHYFEKGSYSRRYYGEELSEFLVGI